MESGHNPILCYGKCWLNFLSEATFNKTNFRFNYFSFLWHKIIFLISNMFIHMVTVFTLNFLPYKPTGPVSSNIYRPTINSTGTNLKTILMTINSNHQNSKHDDIPNILETCQLCIRPKKNICVYTVTCQKNLGLVGRH